MSDRAMTVALVGIGGYGDVYLRRLLELTPTRLTFVGGVDPAASKSPRLAEVQSRNIPIFDSLESLYAMTTPELVILSSPLHLHAEQACFALGRGSHVLCEKPLAATPADAQRMIDARDRSGRMLAVGYQWAYLPDFQRLKGDIHRGRFGKPLRFRTRVYWPRNKAYYARNAWAGRLNTPDGRPVLDSPVNNACAHFVHNMLYLLGSTATDADWPAEVTAELYRANAIENYDTAAIRCMTRGGVEIMFVVSHCTEIETHPTFEFTFEKAVITSGGGDGNNIVARLPGGEQISYGTQPTGDNVEKLSQTIEGLQAGQPPACSAEAAAAHTALMYAAQESSTPSNLPSDSIHLVEFHNSTTVTVRNLHTVLDRCYEQFKLPSELPVPWATPGRTIRVTGLSKFEPVNPEQPS